jgi:hypothetical protein
VEFGCIVKIVNSREMHKHVILKGEPMYNYHQTTFLQKEHRQRLLAEAETERLIQNLPRPARCTCCSGCRWLLVFRKPGITNDLILPPVRSIEETVDSASPACEQHPLRSVLFLLLMFVCMLASSFLCALTVHASTPLK